MPHTTEPTLRVMHAIRLKGFAEPPAIAEATGLPEDRAATIVEELGSSGLATRRDGRICGWMLSPQGKDEHLRLLGEDRAAAGADDEVELGYKGFVDANEAFKSLCTDWQLRVVGGEQVVNDHSDAAYDAAITERLAALHADIEPLLGDLAASVERFAAYKARLASALTRFQSGDSAALARPLSGSYHDVWMELHEDLLLSLGRERGASDGH